MRNLVKLSFNAGPKVLHVTQNDIVYWVDGVEKTFKSMIHGQVIAILAMRYPQTVPTHEIFEILQVKYSVGSRLNPEQTVHKYIHGARQDLSDAGLLMEVVKNIRGFGYRLADGWSVEVNTSTDNLVDREIQDLRSMAQRCVDHLHSRPITINKGGLMFFEADPLLIKENMILIDRIGWQLIHNLSFVDCIPDVLDIKRDISKLLSYVIFWRVGHRLSEEEWRLDYVSEVNKTVEDIELRILKIRKAQASKLKEIKSRPLSY